LKARAFAPRFFLGAASVRPVVAYCVVDRFNNRETLPHGFADVASGVGATPIEAIQRALERLADSGWDIRGLIARIRAENEWAQQAPRNAEVGVSSCFISVYVR
jgi:hypothetical protein